MGNVPPTTEVFQRRASGQDGLCQNDFMIVHTMKVKIDGNNGSQPKSIPNPNIHYAQPDEYQPRERKSASREDDVGAEAGIHNQPGGRCLQSQLCQSRFSTASTRNDLFCLFSCNKKKTSRAPWHFTASSR